MSDLSASEMIKHWNQLKLKLVDTRDPKQQKSIREQIDAIERELITLGIIRFVKPDTPEPPYDEELSDGSQMSPPASLTPPDEEYLQHV